MKTIKKVRVGTRKSALALKQTELVCDLLREKHSELRFEVVGISTAGDRDQKSNLSAIGGKGVFAKEVERKLLDSEIDFAVHSLKDLPAKLPDGLTLAAYPKRANPFDGVVYAGEKRLSDGNLRLGTGSIRREIQLKSAFPELEILPIRGKIETRLKKMTTELLDGIVLACAGLERMSYLENLTYEQLDASLCVPAVGQGILGVECRAEDEQLLQLLQEISDDETEIAAKAERRFLELMDGNCEMPLAAFARKSDKIWLFDAFLSKSDDDAGKHVNLTGENPYRLAEQAFEALA